MFNCVKMPRLLQPTPWMPSHSPSGFRRHSSSSATSECLGIFVEDSNLLSPPPNWHAGNGSRRSIGECRFEKFCERKGWKNRELGFQAQVTCGDMIDGPMDEGVKMTIFDRRERQCWVAESLEEYSIVKATYSNAKKQITVWTVSGTNDLIVVGFEGDEGKTLYPTVEGPGPLYLTTGSDPADLSVPQASRDPRVLRLLTNSLAGEDLKVMQMQSVVHELFITKADGLIQASDVSARAATYWAMD